MWSASGVGFWWKKRKNGLFLFFKWERLENVQILLGGAPGEEAELPAVMANRGERVPGGQSGARGVCSVSRRAGECALTWETQGGPSSLPSLPWGGGPPAGQERKGQFTCPMAASFRKGVRVA